jgi:hypothetical protein
MPFSGSKMTTFQPNFPWTTTRKRQQSPKVATYLYIKPLIKVKIALCGFYMPNS